MHSPSHVCSEMSSLCPAWCRPGEVAGRQEKRMFRSFTEPSTPPPGGLPVCLERREVPLLGTVTLVSVYEHIS